MASMGRIRAAATALLGLVACTTPPAAPAAERWIEPLREAGAVSERWGSARVETGREGGFHWVRCTTSGRGRPALLTNTKPYDPPVDLRGRFLQVWVRVEDVKRIRALELRVSSDHFATNHYAFSVPLFGDPRFGLLQPGRWIPLTFSFGSARVYGEPDRSRIDAVGWYIEDSGDGPLELSWGGLAAEDILYDGVVSLTFDDGYDEHVRVAAPLMAEAGFRGTAYVMPDQIGKPGYVTLEELTALQDRYGWDVAAHHAVPFTDLAPEHLEDTILGIRRYLLAHGFARGADHLALPLGKHDAEHVLPLVRKYFRTTRIAGAGPETLPPADPHRLRVLNVLSTTTPETIGAWARRAREHGEWAILMFHYLVDEPSRDTDYAIDRFRRALEQLREAGTPVRTISEVWADLEQKRIEALARPSPRAAHETPGGPASPAPSR